MVNGVGLCFLNLQFRTAGNVWPGGVWGVGPCRWRVQPDDLRLFQWSKVSLRKAQEGSIQQERWRLSFSSALLPQAGPQLAPALGERLRSPARTDCSVEAKDPAGTQFVRPWFCSPGGRAHSGHEVRRSLTCRAHFQLGFLVWSWK